MKDRPYITLKLSNPPWIWRPLMSIRSISGRIRGSRFRMGFGTVGFGQDSGYSEHPQHLLRKSANGPGVLTVFFVVHRLARKKSASNGDTLICRMCTSTSPINTKSHIFDTAGIGTGMTTGVRCLRSSTWKNKKESLTSMSVDRTPQITISP